jgi:hypothetical protein
MTHEQVSSDRVEWTTHPLKGRTGAAVFLVILLPVLGGGVWLESHNLALSALAVFLVALAVCPALAPTAYVLGPEGITVRHLGRTTTQSWEPFRRVIVNDDLVVVSPFKKPCFLDTVRGIYLRFNRDQQAVREEALRFLLLRIAKPERAQEDERVA